MTKGQLEDSIGNAVVRCEREYAGRGPLEARTYLIDDIVVVRLKEVLTVMEKTLIQGTTPAQWNTYLVKELRTEWVEKVRDKLVGEIQDIVGIKVLSVHEDISTRTGESIFVFVLEQKGDW